MKKRRGKVLKRLCRSSYYCGSRNSDRENPMKIEAHLEPTAIFPRESDCRRFGIESRDRESSTHFCISPHNIAPDFLQYISGIQSREGQNNRRN